MITIAQVLLFLLACLLAIPTVTLFVEVVAGILLPVRKLETPKELTGRVTVLVPAHNEAGGIGATLQHLKAQLRSQDTLLVVADNCTDETAAIARNMGAVVAERHDTANRGKGHALAFGLSQLALAAPDVVIVIDADCRTSEGTILELARLCIGTQRPVQSLDLMRAPIGLEKEYAVPAFAWIVKNQARPLGLARLGLPCQLMGTGMAFPWKCIGNINLSSSNLVEDLELGLTLARAGHAPVFSHDTLVESCFPLSKAGAVQQRRRWERGSMQMLLKNGLGNLSRAALSRNWDLMAMALDMCVPPLVLHAVALIALLLSAAVISLWAGFHSMLLPSVLCLIFGSSVGLAWLKYGRSALPPRQLLSMVPFLLAKLRVHQGFWRKSSNEWTRTDRGDSQ